MTIEDGLNDPETELLGLILTALAGGLPATVMTDGCGILIVEVDHDRLPVFATVDTTGRTVVVTSVEEYRDLVRARTQLLRQTFQAGKTEATRSVRLGLSTIERDTEVADFLRERFRGGVSVDKLRAMCVERFGEERTPSKQRIQRFRQRSIGMIGGEKHPESPSKSRLVPPGPAN